MSSDGAGNFNHVVIRLTDDATLAHCPFIMITEPGGTYFDEAEATALRTYLQKGGFLWADDFWGEYAWEHWVNEIRKALPSGEYPVADAAARSPAVPHALRRARDRADPVDRRVGRAGRQHLGARRDSADAARARDHRSRRSRARAS